MSGGGLPLSPLLLAGVDAHLALAAAILNQALIDLTRVGAARLRLERSSRSRGFVSVRADIDAYLFGAIFETTAWNLGVSPSALRRMVAEFVVDHAERQNA